MFAGSVDSAGAAAVAAAAISHCSTSGYIHRPTAECVLEHSALIVVFALEVVAVVVGV